MAFTDKRRIKNRKDEVIPLRNSEIAIPAHTNPAPGAIAVTGQPNQNSRKRCKPTQTIPCQQIRTAKQLEILRAYAAASANGTKAASVTEVAEIVKLSPLTIRAAHNFLSSMGLIMRTVIGSYAPSPEALAFCRAYERNPETASHELAAVLRSSWFGEVIIPRLTIAAMDESAAVAVLAEVASVDMGYRRELGMLLQFLEAGGVIQREGGHIRLAKQSKATRPGKS
jgi:hypothetical protein